MTDARKRANEKYLAKFESIHVRVPKEVKDSYVKHAEKMEESLVGFIKRAIEETIIRDNDKRDD